MDEYRNKYIYGRLKVYNKILNICSYNTFGQNNRFDSHCRQLGAVRDMLGWCLRGFTSSLGADWPLLGRERTTLLSRFYRRRGKKPEKLLSHLLELIH